MSKKWKYLLVGAFLFCSVAFALSASRIPTDILHIGQRTNGDKYLLFNLASIRVGLRWNNSLSRMEFTNDGTTWFALSAGTPLLNVTSIDNTDSPYSLTTSTDLLLVDSSTASVTVTFPTASTAGSGRVFIIKITPDSVYSVTLNRSSSDTIEGETSQQLTIPGTAFLFFSDGSSAYYAY